MRNNAFKSEGSLCTADLEKKGLGCTSLKAETDRNKGERRCSVWGKWWGGGRIGQWKWKEGGEEQQGRSENFGCLPCYCNAAKSPLGPESCSSSWDNCGRFLGCWNPSQLRAQKKKNQLQQWWRSRLSFHLGIIRLFYKWCISHSTLLDFVVRFHHRGMKLK